MTPTTTAPLSGQDVIVPGLAALLISISAVFVLAFDQGALGLLLTDRLAESGGVLHELFHDARHLLGVPCH